MKIRKLLPVFMLMMGLVLNKAYPQTAPAVYYQFNGNLNQSVGTTPLSTSGPYTINSGGPVGQYLTLSSAVSDYMNGQTISPSTGLCVQMLFRAGYNFTNTRNAVFFQWGFQSVSIAYPSISFTTTNAAGTDDFVITMNGIGRKTWTYLTDGNWHHLAFNYNGTTGRKEVWVDGQLPTGFSKVTGTGNITIWAGAQIYRFNSTTSYVKLYADMDELAVYSTALIDRQIYQNYLDYIAGQHYTTALAASVPAPASVTGSLNPLDFAPGSILPTVGSTTQGVNVTPINQLLKFPKPRYKPNHTLRPIFNGGAPEYEGQRFQPGITDPVATTNDTLIQKELCKNFNFYISVIGNFQNAEQAFANNPANLSFKTSTVTLRAQIPGGLVISQSLAATQYVQNSSGQFTGQTGNTSAIKFWRPAVNENTYVGDGNNRKVFIQNIVNSQTNRPSNAKLDLIMENGEEIYTFSNKGLWTDPRIRDSVVAFGGNYQNWYARRFMRQETIPYRDVIFSGMTGLTNCIFTYYALDGYNKDNEQEGTNINATTLPARFVWSESRKINTPIGTKYYSTPDFYVIRPEFWRGRSQGVSVDGRVGLSHGWTWIVYCRMTEIPIGDDLYTPFMAAGWYAAEDINVRPAQWHGLSKVIAVTGAESYYSEFFNLGTPYPNAANWIWQMPSVSYAQGISSRYEVLLRKSTLMPGDVPVDYSTGGSGYSFYAGDIQKLVVIRKDSTANKYVIGANLNPFSNVQGNVPDSGLATITLAGTTTKFYVRRQGSTYYYDNTTPSAPIFFQLDRWHEKTHPYYWTDDFYFEGEVNDTASAGVTTATVRPNLATGDFSNFTTSIRFAAANDSVQFRYYPRITSTYYAYIRAKSTTGSSTGMTIRNDFTGSAVINCITDTNWVWYRYITSSGTAVQYSPSINNTHTITILATAANLAIDQVVFSTSNTLVTSPWVQCGGPTATITASGPTTFCQGGSVTLTSSPADSYIWNTGATSQAIVVTTSGTYTVTVTVGGSTATSAGEVVTVLPLPTATITPSGTTTFCAGGSVNLTASVNSSYLWSTAATTQTITVTTAGNYTVTVTGANGCTRASAPITVTINPAPTAVITAGGATSFCTGGSVLLTSTTGTGYAYQWRQNGVNIGGATASTYTATASGNYTVVITASGCSATSNTISVTLLADPTATITPSGATTFCTGGSVTLTATANSSYIWSTGASTQAINVTTSGIYTVTVTGANGCTKTSSPTTVTVNPAPTATISAGGSTTFCEGGSVTLTAITGVGYTYQWKRNTVNIAGQTASSYAATTTGNYTVVVTLSGCSATSNIIAVTRVANPTTAAAGADQSICTDSTTLQGNAPASGTGAWTLISGSGTIVSATNPNSAVTGLGAGANVFRWTISNSPCTASTDNVTITQTVSSPVSITITADNNPFCAGESIVFSAFPVNGGSPTYQWKKNAINVGANQPTYTTAGVNGDLIQCVLTSSLVCGSGSPATSNTITVAISSVSAAITAGGATTFCTGGNVVLSANTGSGLTYQWSNSGGNITGETNSTYTASTTETYTCIVTNSDGCSATSNSIAVTVNTLPTATITPSGATTFCSGSSVTLTASANSFYQWSNSATTQAINVTSSGTFTVTVTGASGCTAVSSATTVTVNTTPTAALTPSYDTTFCQGKSITYSTTSGSGYTYQWYNAGTPVNATTRTYTATTSGTYYVIVTAGTCTKSSDSAVVNVTAAPTATITPSGPTTFCSGDSIQLIAAPATTYLWNTGSTAQSIYVKTSGTYNVTVTNTSGCSATAAGVTVVVTTGGSVSISATPSSSGCAGDIIKLKSSSTASNQWSTGATTQTINVTASNTYTVTVTAGNGCTASAAIAVSIIACDSSCAPPTNVRVTGTFNYSVTIAWDQVVNASNYFVTITCLSVPSCTITSTLKGNQTSARIRGLTPNTAYQFTIQSACGDGVYSTITAPLTFRTTKKCPSCPATDGASMGVEAE